MNRNRVKFLTDERHYGDAEPPVPASDHLPEWYKELDFSIGEDGEVNTVRSCISFMEAMTMGWIIPVPYDINIKIGENGDVLSASCDEKYSPISEHEDGQMGDSLNPMMPNPVINFITPWVVRTPEGVSVLVTSPLNRFDERFKGFSGVLDTDEYFSTMNIPSLWTGGAYEGTIKAGTPIIQAIPFPRDGIESDGEIRPMTDEEKERKSDFSYEMVRDTDKYPREVWQKKDKSRVVRRE
jgi:hypothetical protein